MVMLVIKFILYVKFYHCNEWRVISHANYHTLDSLNLCQHCPCYNKRNLLNAITQCRWRRSITKDYACIVRMMKRINCKRSLFCFAQQK